MLEQIVFVITDELRSEAETIRKSLNDCQNIDIFRLEDTEAGIPLQDDGIRIGGKNYKKAKVLFVTDEEKRLRELQEMGAYVIVCLHEENKAENLSSAVYAITDMAELEYDSFVKAYQRLAGEPWRIMETKRCMIRETTVGDVDSLYRIYSEPSITRYMEGLYEEREKEREYAREYIRRIYGFYGYGLWSIVRKENGEVIGRAGLSWRAGFELPELGFVIAVPYQRQGYAYEVCSAILTYARDELQFDSLQALVKEENAASVCLCRKLGFEREDCVEDKEEVYERFLLKLKKSI